MLKNTHGVIREGWEEAKWKSQWLQHVGIL